MGDRDQALALLDEHGASYVRKANHGALWRLGGQVLMVPVAHGTRGKQGDPRGAKNLLALVRRLIREQGLVPVAKTKAPAPTPVSPAGREPPGWRERLALAAAPKATEPEHESLSELENSMAKKKGRGVGVKGVESTPEQRKRIGELRDEHGSLVAAAEALGVSAKTLRRIETGVSVSRDTLEHVVSSKAKAKTPRKKTSVSKTKAPGLGVRKGEVRVSAKLAAKTNALLAADPKGAFGAKKRLADKLKTTPGTLAKAYEEGNTLNAKLAKRILALSATPGAPLVKGAKPAKRTPTGQSGGPYRVPDSVDRAAAVKLIAAHGSKKRAAEAMGFSTNTLDKVLTKAGSRMKAKGLDRVLALAAGLDGDAEAKAAAKVVLSRRRGNRRLVKSSDRRALRLLLNSGKWSGQTLAKEIPCGPSVISGIKNAKIGKTRCNGGVLDAINALAAGEPIARRIAPPAPASNGAPTRFPAWVNGKPGARPKGEGAPLAKRIADELAPLMNGAPAVDDQLSERLTTIEALLLRVLQELGVEV